VLVRLQPPPLLVINPPSRQRSGAIATMRRQLFRSSWSSPSLPTAAAAASGSSSTNGNGGVGRTNGSNGPSIVTVPSTSLKAWESGARMIQNTKVENQYMDHLRDLHDPSLHLKTIEDELKGTIGKALAKQGGKIARFTTLMQQERQQYQELIEAWNSQQQQQQLQLQQPPPPPSRQQQQQQNLIVESAKKYNEHRKNAIQARWELTVHRQAVGFVVNNHKFVHDNFPIPEPLPEHFSNGTHNGNTIDINGNDTITTKKKEQFTDQLDWWQKIGRWK
jgi:hypothetical protein